MALLTDAVLDAALQHIIDNCDRMFLCSAEPTTFAEANATYRLGVKTGPVFIGPANGDIDGRKISVDTFLDGVWEVSGDATHYALADSVNSVLLAVASLSTAPETGVAPDTWSVSTPIDIVLRDPA